MAVHYSRSPPRVSFIEKELDALWMGKYNRPIFSFD